MLQATIPSPATRVSLKLALRCTYRLLDDARIMGELLHGVEQNSQNFNFSILRYSCFGVLNSLNIARTDISVGERLTKLSFDIPFHVSGASPSLMESK